MGFHASWPRVSQPLEVEADVLEIPIAQIIEVEGLRDAGVGFNASRIRQAWIHVHESGSSASPGTLRKLGELLDSWGEAFSVATQGRSSMITTLTPRESAATRNDPAISSNPSATKQSRKAVP